MDIITLSGEGTAKVILEQNNTEIETEVLVYAVAEVLGKWVNNIYGLEPHLAVNGYDFDITPDDIIEYEILDEEYETANIIKFLNIDKIDFEIIDTEPEENSDLFERFEDILKKVSDLVV